MEMIRGRQDCSEVLHTAGLSIWPVDRMLHQLIGTHQSFDLVSTENHGAES
jgi:hypothetical protein